jgi:hypothetical protein
MLQFTRFVVEAEHKMKLEQPPVHINHLEDSILHQGHEGVHQAANFLDDAHQMLSEHKASSHYSTKFDGNPPLVFGVHPHTGQFFVSSPKGQSKVNHTHEDIINNHAQNPKLAGQLITALSHLHKIMPKNSQPGDIFQGDFMHSPETILNKDGHHHFKPNQLVYSAKEDSPHGQAAKNSKIGIVAHSMFGHDGVAMPIDKKTRSKFVNHPDVHNIDPTFTPESGAYKPEDMNKFLKHRDAATKHYRTMSPDSMDAAMVHAPELIKHINDQIMAGKPYDVNSMMDSMNSSHQTRLGGITNEKWRRQRESDHAAKSVHMLANDKHLDKVLKLHKHLGDAKDVLAESMDKSNPWIHSMNGKITPSEGHVAIAPNGSAVKFVQRKEFAKHDKKSKKKDNS